MASLPGWLTLFLTNFKRLPIILKRLFVFDLIVGVIGFLSESLFIVVLHSFLFSIGIVPANENIPKWFPDTIEQTSVILIFYGAMKSLINIGKKMVPAISSHILVREMRKGVFAHLLLTNEDKEQDQIVSDFSEIVPKAGQYLLYIFSIFENALVLIFVTLLSLKIAFYETILSYSLLIALLLPLIKFYKHIQKLGEDQNKKFALINRSLLENLKNLFLIRIYKTQEIELYNIKELLNQHEHKHTKQAVTNSTLSSVPIFAGVLVVTIVALISHKYLNTPPVFLVAFLYLLIRSSQLASNLKSAISNASYYQISFKQMVPYLIFPASSNQMASSRNNITGLNNLDVSIEKLTFSYNEKFKLIDDLSLRIKKGDLLLIKGPSGSGKSTLLKLILGFETPNEGLIKINNQTTQNFIAQNSDSIGYVGPEPFLISGTIKENLQYGNKTLLTDDLIWGALDKVGLSKEIQKMENGLNTNIGFVAFLSTGQKQRISFARALLRNPVFLILDEATANIDFETEKLIIQNIDHIKKDTLTIVVSHKDHFDTVATMTLNFQRKEESA